MKPPNSPAQKCRRRAGTDLCCSALPRLIPPLRRARIARTVALPKAQQNIPIAMSQSVSVMRERLTRTRTVKLTAMCAAYSAIGDGEVGMDGLLAVTGADRLSVPPKAVGASFFARKRWSSNRGYANIVGRDPRAKLVAYYMSRSARASGFICANACNTATPSLLAATGAGCRGGFAVGLRSAAEAFDQNTRGATPSLSANWTKRQDYIFWPCRRAAATGDQRPLFGCWLDCV